MKWILFIAVSMFFMACAGSSPPQRSSAELESLFTKATDSSSVTEAN